MNYLIQSAVMPQIGQYYLEQITKSDFVRYIKEMDRIGQIQNAISYTNTVNYIEKITGIMFKKIRRTIELNSFETLFICRLNYRPVTIKEKQYMKTKKTITDKDVSFFMCQYIKPVSNRRIGGNNE